MKENSKCFNKSALSTKMYKCILCPKTSKTRANLNKHINSHTKEKPYKCTTCSTAYSTESYLKRHTQNVHGKVKKRKQIKTNFKCSVCSYECNGRSMMEVHSRKHSGETPYSCNSPGCGFKTKYLASIRRHVVRLHSHERPFECQSNGCNYKTKDLDHLRQHLKVHSSERPFSCTFFGCNYTSKTKGTLTGHMYNIHCDVKPFKCSTCEVETKYESRLRQHEDDHKNIKRFHCPFPNCKYASNYKTVIRPHFDSSHRPKSVLCTAAGCNFRCGSNALLKVHTKTHLDPILNCPEESCNFSSRQPNDLRKHVACRHEDIQFDPRDLPRRFGPIPVTQCHRPKPLVCTFAHCEYHTEYAHRFDRHMKAHNDESLIYNCKFCYLKFPSNSRLEAHINRHTGEKPFRCSYCEYITAYPTELRYHADKIHGIYVFSCRGKTKGIRSCRICKKISISYNEYVLHSMKHLQVAVVLNRLSVSKYPVK